MAMFGYMTDLDTVEVTETQEIRAEGERCPAPSPLTPSTTTSPSHSFPPLYPLPTSPFLSVRLSPLITCNPLFPSPSFTPHPYSTYTLSASPHSPPEHTLTFGLLLPQVKTCSPSCTTSWTSGSSCSRQTPSSFHK